VTPNSTRASLLRSATPYPVPPHKVLPHSADRQQSHHIPSCHRLRPHNRGAQIHRPHSITCAAPTPTHGRTTYLRADGQSEGAIRDITLATFVIGTKWSQSGWRLVEGMLRLIMSCRHEHHCKSHDLVSDVFAVRSGRESIYICVLWVIVLTTPPFLTTLSLHYSLLNTHCTPPSQQYEQVSSNPCDHTNARTEVSFRTLAPFSQDSTWPGTKPR
jgi:hypothetical protein